MGIKGRKRLTITINIAAANAKMISTMVKGVRRKAHLNALTVIFSVFTIAPVTISSTMLIMK